MRVLVTGHSGYIGSRLVPFLEAAGHEVVGYDLGLYRQAWFLRPAPEPDGRDVREAESDDLAGCDAVVHLAALSNDPLGDLAPQLTYAINHAAALRLASAAKRAGIPRFVFASSCSLYGGSGGAFVDETAPFAPLTPYGETKAWVERDLHLLADESFSPTYLRNATVYGTSSGLRLDVVVNNLTALAVASGEIVLQSDGTPWRPQLHVEDACRAILATIEAPREIVHDQAFNVGISEENYQVKELAAIVASVVEGATVRLAEGAEPDSRSYRVDFSKIDSVLTGFRPAWTVERGVDELAAAFREAELSLADFPRYTRLAEIKRLKAAGSLDEELRWR